MSELEVARGVDDLRRGEIVVVRDGDVALSVQAVERGGALAGADLLITPERAATLKIVNQRAAAGAGAVRLARAAWMEPHAVADPVDDLATPFKGPFPSVDLGPAERAATAALRLAKRAALLPALFVRDGAVADTLVVDAAEVLQWRRAAALDVVARARLPLAAAPDTQVVAFRSRHEGGPDHLALIIGSPGDVPLVRLHSACLTGDLLGSLKCDCGPQLQAAIARIAAEGGMLLYLQQEGRGIGLLNKLRAYALQDQGFDTVDANLRLGFAEDERDLELGAAMLGKLGVARIRLLTNNPLKVGAFEAGGVHVVERVSHVLPANPHNAAYLATKRDRQGHQL
nr:GTP cyclohydrolase II [Sandaracinobacteroides saxicola]